MHKLIPEAHWRRALLAATGLLLLAWLANGWWHASKPIPEGFGVAFPERGAIEVQWLHDLSWTDAEGEQHYQQEIFDYKLALIAQAERFIVADMFLFNDFAGAADRDFRELSAQLTQALIARRQQQPQLQVVVISDALNTLYGGQSSSHFQALRQAGIDVVITPLKPLPDSNPAWSGFWRLCCGWAGNNDQAGWLPNPLGGEPVTLRSYLALLNFKANHRKTLISDYGDNWRAVVSSANPHDASSWHSNTAVAFSGPAVHDLLVSEQAVLHLAGNDWQLPEASQPMTPQDSAQVSIRVLTEAAIRDAALEMIDASQADDRVMLASFYLAHRPMVEALVRASQRGARVQVLLDANRDAFGREKGGIPNRPVAAELVAAGVEVRWCSTQGEQCHSKWLMRQGSDGSASVISGSANFTRRNLDNLNLETSVQLRGNIELPELAEPAEWFQRRWNNPGQRQHSLPYGEFADESRSRYWRYRVMEASGLSTF